MSVTAPIIRVDKFIVPEESKPKFLRKVRDTHQLLKKQSGFVKDFILEQTSGTGVFNIVTIVEWESQSSIDKARDRIMEHHGQVGFDPQSMMQELNVESDIANYQPVTAEV